MRGTRYGDWSSMPAINGITNINTIPKTEEDIEAEKRYRLEERLAIMCGAGVPTDEQLAIAIEEAEMWEANWRLTL